MKFGRSSTKASTSTVHCSTIEFEELSLFLLSFLLRVQSTVVYHLMTGISGKPCFTLTYRNPCQLLHSTLGSVPSESLEWQVLWFAHNKCSSLKTQGWLKNQAWWTWIHVLLFLRTSSPGSDSIFFINEYRSIYSTSSKHVHSFMNQGSLGPHISSPTHKLKR